jgi:cyclic beta-1,2-glucan synthetase
VIEEATDPQVGSAEDGGEPRDAPSESGRLERPARHLARSHEVESRRPRPLPSLAHIDEIRDYFVQVRRHFISSLKASPEAAERSKAGEWILDNSYVIERVLRQIRIDLPGGFYTRLPRLCSGPHRGLPRIYDIARNLASATDFLPDLDSCIRFINGYQDICPLQISELWALPTMLRLVALEELTQEIAEFVPEVRSSFELPFVASFEHHLDPTESIARTIQSLRAHSLTSWKTFFQRTSVVERVLLRDPAGVYVKMDFETRDRYRKIVEEIARETGRAEHEVAEKPIELAEQAQAEKERDGEASADRREHVGYFLLGEGRAALESILGYRPGFGERSGRLWRNRPTLTYLGAITLITAVTWLLPCVYLAHLSGGFSGLDHRELMQLAVYAVLALLPASAVAITLVQWGLTNLLPPSILPKMDFERGIPGDYQTLVVIPTLLGSLDQVDSLIRQIELHHLSNPDPSLRLALLTDHLDAPEERVSGDDELEERAAEGIRGLNRKYARGGLEPFHLLHRARRFNPSENCWMGWERKRGKLEELNELLLGNEDTTYTLHVGDRANLEGTRFVITLDTDTQLPRGGAARLVSILAHPLNEARFDSETGRVMSGYTIIQPRVEISPGSSNGSVFMRVFSGDVNLDIYTRAVSDVYQDLFGAGLYIGKGIYDLRAFRKSLEGRAPENALVSHDLFEGIHGRVGLATDIVLYEEYPPHYLAFVHRMHRWIRGDWQLLPWLARGVPSASGGRVRNRFTVIDRWKILDNLRRSLFTPALLLFLVAGWLWLPGSPGVWTLLALLAPGAHILAGILSGIGRVRRRGRFRPGLMEIGQGIGENSKRLALSLAFLPHEAIVISDAIVRTLSRLNFTRRNFLEWRTAAHTARLFADRAHLGTWKEMSPSLVLTFAITVAIAVMRPEALLVAAPLLVVWFLAPGIANWISRAPLPETETITDEERRRLRDLACRTWLFYETFVGAEDQWLPPDNYQEKFKREVAHRTSPTNIGMYLLSTLAARDLGYLPLTEMIFRIQRTLDTLREMERFRGHLLNWYDTCTLDPLVPRYVSTVDSGNFVGAMVTLKQGCLTSIDEPMVREETWDGLLDNLGLLSGTVDRIAESGRPAAWEPLSRRIEMMRDVILVARDEEMRWWIILQELCEDHCDKLDQELLAILEQEEKPPDLDSLRDLKIWTGRVRRSFQTLREETELLMPWLALLDELPEILTDEAISETAESRGRELQDLLRRPLCLGAAETTRRRADALLDALLDALADDSDGARDSADLAGLADLADWTERIRGALQSGVDNARNLRHELQLIADHADGEVRETDFSLLYDRSVSLFHIGFNISANKLDPNHYDLLASEARVASYIAIAKADIPIKHWFHLGRPTTRVGRESVLLSWGATMFEYLMPELIMAGGPDTLISRSCRGAVEAQIAYGRKLDVPWGISESGFHHFDADRNYQYQAFGVPGLGFRRGLADDLVIAPYASVMAVGYQPTAVLENLARLEELGMIGPYGLYEAMDYTASRVPQGKSFARVRSYMAHHQGMVFLALTNFLAGDVMKTRFAADPLAQSISLLLNEQVPSTLPNEKPHEDQNEPPTEIEPPRVALPTWNCDTSSHYPMLHVLSNGTMSTGITDSGGGFTRWRDVALTAWSADSTCDGEGTWIYVSDLDAGELWSVGKNPAGGSPPEYGVIYSAHLAEFNRRERGLFLRTEVSVAPSDDVEIRIVTITNETARPRHLALTSYAEVVLAPEADYRRHPAFSKLFVQSEFLEEFDALLFTRRPRSSSEKTPVLVHRLLKGDEMIQLSGHETMRDRFLGRGRTTAAPEVLVKARKLSGTTGTVLDPVMSLQADVQIPPHGTVSLGFVTIVAGSRRSALELTTRYGSLSALEWSLRDAAVEAGREVQRVGVDPTSLPLLQRLLATMLMSAPFPRVSGGGRSRGGFTQPRLWGFGISGDFPILLVRATDVPGLDDLEVLSEVLLAHRYWRRLGQKIDVVILRQGVSGYDDDTQGNLRRVLEKTGAREWLNRPGGVFLIRADQVTSEDRFFLEQMARVVFEAGGGTIAEQLDNREPPTPELPRFVPPLPIEDAHPERRTTPRLKRPDDLLFDNSYGGFSPDGREYVIHLEEGQRTPAPWSNVLANPEFGTLVTESGLGNSWAVNSGENRLTPWGNDPVSDPSGEVIYLRDEETAGIWTPTALPIPGPGAHQVRHGAGYTDYLYHGLGLEHRLRVFVAPHAPVKLFRLRLKNTWTKPRRLTATFYAEWVLGTDRTKTRQHVRPSYHGETGSILATCEWNPDFVGRTAFVASSAVSHGATSDRTEFLGRNRSTARPAALERWGLCGTFHAGVDPCAALQIHIDIPAGGETEVHFLLGQGATRDEALELLRTHRNAAVVDQAWDDLQEHWDGILGRIQVETPDPAMNLMLNRWLLYQSLTCRVFGRTALYQSSGAFGYRDQLQDVAALTFVAPEITRRQILEAASHQFEEGDVLHWWHPPGDAGVRTRCSDDLLWLPWVVTEYVRTTGDYSILDETVSFLRADGLREDEHDRYGRFESTHERVSILAHCRRALERGSTQGAKGLPLIGSHDWNDGMSEVGVAGLGESVWLAWFTIDAQRRFAELCDHLGEHGEAKRWRRRARELAENVEEHAWEGDRYLRAWYDDGTPLGSASSDEACIFSLAQSWGALSGAGDPERTKRAVRTAVRELVDDEVKILRLFHPPFDRTEKQPGYIKGYPPGLRENGGQYTHAATWLAWANRSIGDYETCGRLVRYLNPILKADSEERANTYRVEPYVIAADVYGTPPYTGRGGWTWYTGAAAWSWRLGMEGVLGITFRGGDLCLDPGLPPDWDGYRARIELPDATLDIEVRGSGAALAGNPRFVLDGETMLTHRVPLRALHGHHKLEVMVAEAEETMEVSG